jgi:hypothetical protein
MERKKVPFSKDFYISKAGNVFDALGNERNTSVNGDGYITVNIKTDDNRWITFGVHRVLALTYIPRERGDRNQVNHRDLDITNNTLANLEWVSCLENNIHSVVMRTDNTHIALVSVKDDVVLKGYRSTHEAAIDCNCKALDIWDSVKNGSDINGVRYCFRRYSENVPLALKQNRRDNFRLHGGPASKAIKMMDIHSGEVMEFGSIGEGARHFETHPSHVFQAISKTNYPRVFRKQYQVVYAGDDFPAMSLEELERAKSHGSKTVLAYEVGTRKLYMFKSAVAFIEHTELSKKAVTVALKKNKIRVINGWVALYQSAENVELLKSYTSSPVEM